MGLTDIFRRKPETRNAVSMETLELLSAGGRTGFSTDRASGLSVAHASIQAIAGTLASVPLHAYRRTANGGRERAADHPLYGVLHDAANDQMTAYELRESALVSLLMTGNAYLLIVWNGRGQVGALRILDPASVSVERLANDKFRYKVIRAKGGHRYYLQEEILHIRYRLARDGIMGICPIRICRETFALALSQQDAAGKQAKKGFRPEGALVFPNLLGKEGKDNALSKLAEKIESTASTSGVMVLDGGAEWRGFSLSSKDAEFLESRKLTNLDICRIFGIPPTVVGITDNATYSNVDGENRAFVARCLAPMARRIEAAMNAALLPATARKSMFIEHDLAGLLRGDLKARYEAYRIGREWGWLSPNEIRGWENLSEIKDGEEYLSPLNMTTVGERESDDED